jgi:hypothetical protein
MIDPGIGQFYRATLFVMLMTAIGGLAFAAGVMWSTQARADDKKPQPRVVYPEKSNLNFEGTSIEGEIRNPGEFYFQHRNEEKFDSLVKRRKNFHREMLRDAVSSK